MHAINRSFRRFILFFDGKGNHVPNSIFSFFKKNNYGQIDTGMIYLTRVNILPVNNPPDRLVLPDRACDCCELVDFNSEG